MPAQSLEKTPGPQYFPGDRPEKKKAPKHTFGYRRDKGAQNCLTNLISTPANVGPGRYMPEACVDPSTKKTLPKWTLPKGGRSASEFKSPDTFQTYDTRSAFGKQPVSKNKSSGYTHFGQAGRAAISKMGTFKDTFTGAMKVRMPHNYM